MRYSSRIVTAAAVLPVDAALLSSHMRGIGCGEDELAEGYVKAAIEIVRQRTGLAPIAEIWQTTYSAVFEDDYLPLPLWPVQALVEVATLAKGVATVQASGYWLDTAQRRFWLDGISGDQIRVKYEVGFGDVPEAVPEDLRQALLMLATHLYENRAGESSEVKYAVQVLGSLPPTVEGLLSGYMPWL